MSVIYLVGEKFNAIEGRTITPSSVNTLFPAANLYNGVPSVPFMFESPEEQATIDVDLNMSINGDFADWTIPTVPDGWTDNSIGTGALSESGGTCYVDGNNSDNYASGYQLVILKSGYHYTVTARAKGDGGTPLVCRVINLDTGKHLADGTPGTWEAPAATPYLGWISQTPGTFATTTTEFETESYADTGLDTQRIVLFFSDAANGYVDDFYIWPHWDFVSIHGHNIMPRTTNVLALSDSNPAYSSTTTQGTMTVENNSMYALASPIVDERYFELLFNDTMLPTAVSLNATTTIGELVVGQLTTATLNFHVSGGIGIQNTIPMTRLDTSSGQSYVANWSDYDKEKWTGSFLTKSETERDELREIFRRAKYGAIPAVLVPSDVARPLYGRFAGSVEDSHSGGDLWTHSIEFEEMPHFLGVS